MYVDSRDARPCVSTRGYQYSSPTDFRTPNVSLRKSTLYKKRHCEQPLRKRAKIRVTLYIGNVNFTKSVIDLQEKFVYLEQKYLYFSARIESPYFLQLP
jgi:hypothetical protein